MGLSRSAEVSRVAETVDAPESAASRTTLLLYVGLLAGLILVLYAPVLKRLVRQWWDDPDFGHGFLVVPFVAYIVWTTRQRWLRLRLEPRNSGLAIILLAVALLVLGSVGAELFTSRVSLLVLLAGTIVFLTGWTVLRAFAFPLGYLLVMIPVPAIIYNQITFPLQLFASRLAATILDFIRVPVLREGNLLILPNYTLEVVEACSGIRSLMSMIALAVAYGYLAERRLWMRVVLVLLMLPIVVLSNGLRIVGTGLLTYKFGPETAEGFFHTFSGWLIFLTATTLMLACHWTLNRLFPARPLDFHSEAAGAH
jgi:exosortase